jgi:hypothetical protein
MCLTTNLVEDNCVNTVAGVVQIDIFPLSGVEDVVVNATSRIVTDINYVATLPATTKWSKIKPAIDTAFANNAQKRNGNSNSVNTAQVISFVLASVTCSNLAAVQDLAECCGFIAIVHYADGNSYLYGVGYNKTNQKVTLKGLKTGDGSWNSGADGAADRNELITTFTANVANYPLCVEQAVVDALEYYP